jgi:[acyl-carrier-protein] S-malonyltransferase
LAVELEKVEISDNQVPVVSNVNAQVIMDKYEIKRCLVEQVSNSVLWEDSIRHMIGMGVDTFIEVGPGKTLTAFTKKIDKSLYVYNVEDMESLENTIVSIRERLECI